MLPEAEGADRLRGLGWEPPSLGDSGLESVRLEGTGGGGVRGSL